MKHETLALREKENNDFFNFIFAIEIFFILLLIHFFYNFFFSSFTRESKISSLWELNVYVGGWMCDGILCCLLLSLFLYLLSFISNLDLKGKTFRFMYSSYVISSFLITNHLEQILFRFSRKAF